MLSRKPGMTSFIGHYLWSDVALDGKLLVNEVLVVVHGAAYGLTSIVDQNVQPALCEQDIDAKKERVEQVYAPWVKLLEPGTKLLCGCQIAQVEAKQLKPRPPFAEVALLCTYRQK